MPDPFPAALRRLRDARGLTQQALADSIGTSRPAVGRMEAGASKPSLGVLRKLADALSVTLDELTGRTTTTKDDVR